MYIHTAATHSFLGLLMGAPVQAGPKLGQLLVSPDWRCRHAALICLAQIAEGCSKVLTGQLRGLVDMCEKVRTLTWFRRLDEKPFSLGLQSGPAF